MICPNCKSYQSGDFCGICGFVFKDKPAPKKTIAKRSDKGKAEDLIYNNLRKKFLRENPRCQVYPNLKAIDVHHVYGRTGGNYLNVKTWMAVSRQAHEKIHREHQWAVDNGYIKSKLAKEENENS